MGQGKSCEAPEDAQKGTEDLALAGLLLVAPRILVAEKDGRSPADSLGETHLLQEDAASAASSRPLEGKDKEACDYFWAFLTGTQKEEDSKLKFLASICTLCGARLEGRYLPDGKLGAEKMMQLPKSSSAHLRAVIFLGWQAAYAITERSKENLAVLSQHLGPCINTICSLAPERERGKLDASVYAQILKSLDSVLEVLVCASPGYTASTLEIILQALLPFTESQKAAVRRCAVGRIARLSEVLVPASLVQDLSRHRAGTVNLCPFQTKPVPLLGQLMGCLTLCCAEEDHDISCASAEALHAIHRIMMVRQSYMMTPAHPKLRLEEECPSTFLPKETANEMTVFGSFLLPIERRAFILTVLEGMTQPRVADTKVVARVLDVITDSQMEEVPWVMQIIHDCLVSVSKESLLDSLNRTLFQITSLDPEHAVQGLLEAFPWCDRVATAMWQTMVSEPRVAEDVLRSLLMQRTGPEHDGFGPQHSCVRSWAVTSAMHKIFQLPSSKGVAQSLFHKFYVAVLFQISFTHECTLQDFSMSSSQTGERMWPPGSFLRTAVMTMRALFQHLKGAALVEDIQTQGGWDMLLSPETFHTGVAVLTRALRSKAPLYCASMFEEAVTGLCQRRKHKEIVAMAVFTELLDCVDFEQHIDDCILNLLQSHMHSQSLVLRRMAVTSLVVLSTRPKTAVTLQGLLPEVMQQLQDADGDISMKALTVLRNALRLADGQVAGPIALQLPERLLPLFENESSCVRELSILLCKDAMEVAEGTHETEMKKQVQSTLLPLFFHLHDQNQCVAQASREALLGAAKLLKWKQLRNLLETAQPQRVGKCLLLRHSSRVDDYLCQSLPYLWSPQEPLQEAAVRFIGLAGQHLVDGREEKLKNIIEALRSTEGYSSPSVSSLVAETILVLRAPSEFSLQALRYRLRRVWERRPRVPRAGWLCCCSCAQR
ncbi:maestro heat-like repeat-containing protein family member 7 [Anser cygnoides]|uniref:maestro heat-like repeat-containing protein family member 7 n=1 Tax=Anser cygnoides TaxID=8845 RepID=UPI0034D1A913